MPELRRLATSTVLFLALLPALAVAHDPGTRVPGETWMRYTDVTQAGFDAAALEAARQAWEDIPSAAFLVIADGAVVAAWGDVDRRFMCHSVRKSFLTALYGIYWDRGEIELNKTLADLGIDDEPDPLLDVEKRARILDLLKARSGVFHTAAYAGRTDSRPRGSEGPGRYFAYNNWDFNTAAAILMQETGIDVFDAFDEHFGQPLQMEDWRVSDGYYHYQRELSKYPAYPFRMSARDAARFGLLYARNGLWGDQRILSSHWVQRSSTMYSIDNESMGYGFMWWVHREPRFLQYGIYSALGVGNQTIAVIPALDMVIVNRANTYEGEGTPSGALADLIDSVLQARTAAPVADPDLAILEASPEPGITNVPNAQLADYAGSFDFPAPALGLPAFTTIDLEVVDGHLRGFSPVSGTLALYLQDDGSLHEEDSYTRYLVVRDEHGAFSGIADVALVVSGAINAAAEDDAAKAEHLLGSLANEEGVEIAIGAAMVEMLGGAPSAAESTLEDLAAREGPAVVEGQVNRIGYLLLGAEKATQAREVFALNTRLFPEAPNTWDSLGEAHLALGDRDAAIRCYEHVLELDTDNQNAQRMLERIRADADGGR